MRKLFVIILTLSMMLQLPVSLASIGNQPTDIETCEAATLSFCQATGASEVEVPMACKDSQGNYIFNSSKFESFSGNIVNCETLDREKFAKVVDENTSLYEKYDLVSILFYILSTSPLIITGFFVWRYGNWKEYASAFIASGLYLLLLNYSVIYMPSNVLFLLLYFLFIFILPLVGAIFMSRKDLIKTPSRDMAIYLAFLISLLAIILALRQS